MPVRRASLGAPATWRFHLLKARQTLPCHPVSRETGKKRTHSEAAGHNSLPTGYSVKGRTLGPGSSGQSQWSAGKGKEERAEMYCVSYASCCTQHFFFCYFFIYFFLFVVNFVIHLNETAMGLHVFPIPIPPPTSLSTRSLQVFPVHQVRALVSCIQPGLLICFILAL